MTQCEADSTRRRDSGLVTAQTQTHRTTSQQTGDSVLDTVDVAVRRTQELDVHASNTAEPTCHR